MPFLLPARHPRFRLPVATFAPLLAALCLSAGALPVIPEVLDPGRARIEANQVVLSHGGDHHRLLGEAPILFHVEPPLDGESGMGLEITIRSSHPAEVDLVGIYGGEQTYVFPRRTTDGGMRRLRWELPQADQLTSFTLNLRSGAPQEASFEFLELRNLDPLAEGYRLEAMHDRPLSLRRKGDPVREDILDLIVHVPEFFKSQLGGRNPRVELTDSLGSVTTAPVTPVLAPEREDPLRNRVPVSVELPDGWQGPLSASLVVPRASGEDIRLRPIQIDTSSPSGPWCEVEDRSIESLAVMIRNEELALFLSTGDEGVPRSAAGIPLLTDQIWLAVGDGENWPVSESLIRSRRDVDWMAGGQTSLAASRWGNTNHLVFTLAAADGTEAVGTAQGVNSLRLLPSARNPVWSPPPRPTGATPSWRGNALFDLHGNMALIGLEKADARDANARLLMAEHPWRWSNLGGLPLEGLDPSAETLTGYTTGGEHFLLAGPTPQLFQSEDVLRGWRQVALEDVPQWREPQLADWQGRTWLFGIEERNGGGIVRWTPVERGADGFMVTDPREIAKGAENATD